MDRLDHEEHERATISVLDLPEVLTIYQRAVGSLCQQVTQQRPVCVHGTPRKKAQTSSGRGPVQFFLLEGRGVKLEVKASTSVEIPWNHEGDFDVLLGIANWGKPPITPQLELLSVRRQAEEVEVNHEARLAQWQAAIERPKRSVQSIFQKDKPWIVVVTTQGGEAWVDIEGPIAELRDVVALQAAYVRMSDPASVRMMLERIYQHSPWPDLLILARGGGDAIQALDEDALLDRVVNSPVPIVTAIGHSRDTLILDRVADYSLATPRECGLWLKQQLERAHFQRRDIEHVEKMKALDRVPVLEVE